MSEPQPDPTGQPNDTRPTTPLPPGYAPIPAPPEGRGQRRLLLIIAGLLSAFIMVGCLSVAGLFLFVPDLRARLPGLGGASAAGAPPVGPNKFGLVEGGPVKIADSFDSPSERWDRSQTRIVDGAYELGLELANFDSYGLYLEAGEIKDFDMAVDVTQTAGDPVSEFGIRFRQSAPDEHLIFSISGNGYYRLARVSDEQYTSVVGWTRDERIRTGLGSTNRLRVVADGDQITGYINGEQVLTYTDRQGEVGQLTLGVVTFDAGGLVVRFDNVEGFALIPAPLNDVQPTRVDLAETFGSPEEAPWSIGGATIAGGVYDVFVGGQVQSWQQPLPTGSSKVEGDFVLEVEATLVDGVVGEGGNLSGNGYGIMFGDDGAFNFFSLLILPEGGLMMSRTGPDGGSIIQPVQVDVINPGLNATNRIRLEASGNVLTLTINGETFPPLEFAEGVRFDGRVGVLLNSSSPDGLRVRFDNFSLEEQ